MYVVYTRSVEHQETLEYFGKGIRQFASLKNGFIYTSVQDPAAEVPSGYNDKNGVAVWSKGGKTMVDVEFFMKSMEAMMPDFYQALSDGDTEQSSTAKRTKKSVDRTLDFLDEILQIHNKSPKLKNTAVFGVIEGGFLKRERERSAKNTAARAVQGDILDNWLWCILQCRCVASGDFPKGFVLEGLHRSGVTSESVTTEKMNEVLSHVINNLPEDKPRLMQSLWTPAKVLEAVEQGIDIFDSSYPYLATERGAALVFSFQSTKSLKESNNRAGLKSFEIALSDPDYAEDFSPILDNCTCYSCTNFTRAYINHLLKTSEILARVLLMLHNFSHYFGYFEAIRQALKDNAFLQLKALIQEQASMLDKE
ncbi:queuine tRNA-ribosyltransferase accessory subunit 2 isoform X3 [Octopus bimaculoides]|uniref:queuine tRNA-ribosyltransferase accessory subunit 2 isoform X3 n=1 Tax=Octopus bimaculoides TaxID=37653 RepID=UPI00071C84BE|nr:queuine tRNA-ribosyltransferase accessory subunit 2 isoform X3 [Octopus bimaculoides]XP_052831300.1 queuine tRNA-ribosyltransferase accessory subunit 2 isoform X3 [Octopus bimaculoides]XP_052831301.1 queuine tRNA-ribosyltransferase accessory subunit 2 isoform X3 [Octopus bimaculoides]XP_052831302.1 queuine tRNA-ribosyltransferase accessory subunit 2 isoform X3 [Octopus bimaculoides]|eukprot:XP_014789636.1 PREDICTED: queuine tRNA-ribosyltransferase subunit QTRTD1-like isoform X3 [Octopus bimaculoides]